jgi:hypothetical protein
LEGLVWRYETDETPKKKHQWSRNEAGSIEVGGAVVSKCPNDLTTQEAEEMLNAGIPWSPRNWTRDYPQRIYAVRLGVVYRATTTNPGVSYHGFPELIEKLPPDRVLREKIFELGKSQGFGAELKRWLRS